MDNRRHASIRASAGSGKTFVLSQRFIGLLARGVPVERITALTFSRKAAREIFESVIEHLCTAAAGPREAARASEHVGMDISHGGFGEILCQLLRNLHRLRVGTIDSFITGILRLFPEHYAVPPDFSLFDSAGEEARKVHGMVLGRILSGSAGETERFAKAFYAATAGRHEKRLGSVLEKKLMGSQEIYRSAPDCRYWGAVRAEGAAAGERGRSAAAAAAALTANGEIARLPEKARHRWRVFLEAASGRVPGSSWSRELDYLFAKITAARQDILDGTAHVAVERSSLALEGSIRDDLLALLEDLVGKEIEVSAERSRGLCRLLQVYEREYGHVVRSEGRMSFSDAVEFVAGQGPATPSLVREREDRLYIEYRLDARLDHWLIDEFQDTSRRQWDIFANLADEILQSRDGERTFFVVGDPKQAIYGWRGGDAALLGEFTEQYGEQLEQVSLSRSYRSSPAVIEAVNLIFGNVAERGLPDETAASWQALWRDHTSGGEAAGRRGVAMVVEPTSGEIKPSLEDRYGLVARILEETVAGRTDLSAGILVRTNEGVRRAAEYLRRHCPSVPVESDGPAAILDSLAVGIILSMVRLAFHPGDRSSLAHVLMSPLAEELEKKASGKSGLPMALLAMIRNEGYPEFVSHWGERIAASVSLDEFECRRIAQLQTAAVRFAARGGREGDDFCAFVESLRLREPGGAAVRIMTAHQSKGLDFDMVILPDLQDWGSMDKPRAGEMSIARDDDGEVLWVMSPPRRSVAAWDDRLAAAARKRDSQAALQELSLLYVAATRARSALYIVTGYPGKTARALTPAAFVKKGLGSDETAGTGRNVTLSGVSCPVLFQCGDNDWHRRAGEVVKATAAPPHTGRFELKGESLERVIPSSREEGVFDAEWILGASSRRALQFGEAVHGLFQKVVHAGSADTDLIIAQWRGETNTPEGVRAEAEDHFRRALDCKEVREALGEEEGLVELWREKAFDVVVGSSWLSGIFDRVEVFDHGAGGRRARITDYKSDGIAGGAALEKAIVRYRGQMETYGEALGIILGLERAEISLRLIFTGPGVVCDIMEEGSDRSWVLNGAP